MEIIFSVIAEGGVPSSEFSKNRPFGRPGAISSLHMAVSSDFFFPHRPFSFILGSSRLLPSKGITAVQRMDDARR